VSRPGNVSLDPTLLDGPLDANKAAVLDAHGFTIGDMNQNGLLDLSGQSKLTGSCDVKPSDVETNGGGDGGLMSQPTSALLNTDEPFADRLGQEPVPAPQQRWSSE
jgi:hypothetical protein